MTAIFDFQSFSFSSFDLVAIADIVSLANTYIVVVVVVVVVVKVCIFYFYRI